jgi:hypothetical protein
MIYNQVYGPGKGDITRSMDTDNQVTENMDLAYVKYQVYEPV